MSNVPNLTGFDRGLPANVDAERTLLGAVLLDNAAWPEIRARLVPDDFSLDSHRRIVIAIAAIQKTDPPRTVDIITLSNELMQRRWIEAIGGVAYLASLTEGLPRRPVIDEYIRIVKDKSILRRLMGVCSATIARAADQSETALEVLGAHEQILQGIVDGIPNTQATKVADFMEESMQVMEAEYDQRSNPTIPTGNNWLDAKMGGGYRRGKYTIMAARPKIGKTGNGLKSIAYNCIRGRKSAVYSLEMDKTEILKGLLPHVIDLPNIVVSRPWTQTPDQRRLVMHGLEQILEWPLEVFDGDMDCDQVCWSMEKIAGETEKGDVLFMLDHFGLLQSSEKDIRRRYIEHSDRLRKTIKKLKNAALLNLFQLNEVGREYADKRPQPNDLSESKKPMQDCYAMILLHRYQDKETMKLTAKGNINLCLLRGGGSPGNVDCDFNRRKLCFDAEADLGLEDQEFYS